MVAQFPTGQELAGTKQSRWRKIRATSRRLRNASQKATRTHQVSDTARLKSLSWIRSKLHQTSRFNSLGVGQARPLFSKAEDEHRINDANFSSNLVWLLHPRTN